jgi:hypothetical protein
LREADALINQAEKISTQLSIQAVTWVMLYGLAEFAVRIGSNKQSTKDLK